MDYGMTAGSIAKGARCYIRNVMLKMRCSCHLGQVKNA